jgi:hypothetical protein
MNLPQIARAHLIANKRSGRGFGDSLFETAKQLCHELSYELVYYDVSDAGYLGLNARTGFCVRMKRAGQ